MCESSFEALCHSADGRGTEVTCDATQESLFVRWQLKCRL